MTGEITVGMVFERQGAPYIRCVVEALTNVGGLPHVYLRRVGDPTDVRLLSVNAVANKREFLPTPALRSDCR